MCRPWGLCLASSVVSVRTHFLPAFTDGPARVGSRPHHPAGQLTAPLSVYLESQGPPEVTVQTRFWSVLGIHTALQYLDFRFSETFRGLQSPLWMSPSPVFPVKLLVSLSSAPCRQLWWLQFQSFLVNAVFNGWVLSQVKWEKPCELHFPGNCLTGWMMTVIWEWGFGGTSVPFWPARRLQWVCTVAVGCWFSCTRGPGRGLWAWGGLKFHILADSTSPACHLSLC